MNPTTFDYRMQALTCPSCGAPLVTVREGGAVRCNYCFTTSIVNARKAAPQAGLRSSLAEETERLSRLKAQLEHPVSGHFYDLTRRPSGFEQWSANNSTDVERLHVEWNRAVHQAHATHAETQRRVCWMALQFASAPQAQGPLRARAVLETTLGWLDDEGYRHLIRCRLAEAALEENDLDAAAGWVAECDLAPSVLELDSALRLVRAWLACRSKNPEGVLELLGDEGVRLPIAAYKQDEAERLRVDALEALNQNRAAYRQFCLLAQKNGIHAECERFTHGNLALRTVRAALCRRLGDVTEHRAANLKTKIAVLDKRREQLTAMSATRPLRRLPLYAMGLAFIVWLVRCSYNIDPLGGTYGYALCPEVCAQCQGPTRTVTEWVETGAGERGTNGPQYFCQTPTHPVQAMSAQELTASVREFKSQELGAFSAFFATFAMLVVMVLPFAILQSLRRANRNRIEFMTISSQLTVLAKLLGEPASRAPSHLARSIRLTVVTLGVVELAALLLAWWTA